MLYLVRIGMIVAAATALGGSAALAYENFIPLGTGYSAEVNSLPRFDSEAGDVIVRSDIYESELYRLGRNQAEADSFFRRFQSDAETTGGDTSIDY